MAERFFRFLHGRPLRFTEKCAILFFEKPKLMYVKKEPDKMEKQNHISQNRKLKFLYQLLPQYYQNEDESTYLEKLRKAIYYNTGKGTTIKEKLKSMEFQVERYSEKEIFIFYLTYLQLIHTNRPLIRQPSHRAPTGKKQPNQKLISNIQKFDVDYSFCNVGIQFLIAYELYQALEKENKEEQQFVESYNDYLIFMHLQVKEFLAARGMDSSSMDELEERTKQIKRAEDRAVFNHLKHYYQEEQEIREQITMLHLLNQNEAPFTQMLIIAGTQLVKYDPSVYCYSDLPASSLYTLLFYLRHFFMICETITMRLCWEKLGSRNTMQEEFFEFIHRQEGEIGDSVSWVREAIRTNILLDFGARMLFQQERCEYLYRIELLKGLLEESKQERNTNEKTLQGSETEQLDDVRLAEIETGELIALIIPNKEQRPAGIRNSIKEKVRNTIWVLERLEREYGKLGDTRDAQYIKLMYEELYQYNAYRYKQGNSYHGIIKHIKAGTVSRGELLLLKEKQIRGLFRMKQCMDQYPTYVEKQTIFLEGAVQIYSSFEHWMES